MKKIDKKTVMLLYIIIFYAIWTCFELFVKDSLDRVIANDVLCQLVKSGIIKNIVWTIPAIMLVKHFENDVNISLKEMFNPRINWIKYLPLFALFTVYLLVGAFVTNGEIAIVDEFGIDKNIENVIDEIIALRKIARDNKDWAKSDEIRDKLKNMGIVLEDTPNGVKWKKRN